MLIRKPINRIEMVSVPKRTKPTVQNFPMSVSAAPVGAATKKSVKKTTEANKHATLKSGSSKKK